MFRPWEQYTFACLAVAAGLGLRLVLTAWFGPALPPYITFYPVVMLVAMRGGFGPGAVATALASGIAAYWIVPPVGQFSISSPIDRVALVLFSGMGLAVSVVAELYRHGQLKAAADDREEERRHNQQRVLLASEAAQMGFWSWQPVDDTVVWENEYPYQILGVPASSPPVTATRFAKELLHPEDLPAFQQAIARTVQDREPFAFVGRIRRPDGETRWVEFTGKTEPVEDGRPPRFIGTVQDITERKLNEISVSRLAAIVESSQDAIVSKDLSGIITSWNRGAETIFGYSAEEMIGQPIQRLIPPERRDEEADILSRVGRGEGVRHFETVRLRKDGSTVEVSITVSPVKDASGTIVGISKVARDIAERRRVEESLRQNASLFSSLIAQAPMGTYVVDAEFRMRQVNAEAMPVFATVQPLLGRNFNEVMQILWGQEVGEQIAGIFRHTLETGERYVSPPFTERRHDLGIEQTYEWETQRVTLPDGQRGVVCYFHEVTERARATAALRASERRMRLATEATGVGIWEWNLVTNQIRWDAELFRIYGITPTPNGFVDYTDWSAAVVPEDLAANEAILQDTVRRCGQSERTFRIRRRNDGEKRYVEAVETVRTDALGQAEWVVGTNLDITERKRAEEELRRLASELSEADRRKDEFLATLAHELRNPLAPIRNGLQIMRLSNGNGSSFEQARNMMERQLGQMVHLVDDLLDLSRISRGKLELRQERIELAAVLENAVETSRPLIEADNHELTVVLPPQPILVDADMTRLGQVFANLLNNAAKYSERGGRIEVVASVEGRVASEIEGEHSDGGATLSRTQGVASGDEFGRTVLPRDEGLSQGGTLRPDQPDSPSGSVDPSQHRRGSRSAAHQGIPELPEHCEGIAHGAGNAPPAQSKGRLAQSNDPGLAPRHDGRNQPDAVGAAAGAGSESLKLAARHTPLATPFAVVSIKDTGVGISPEMLPKVFEMFTQVDRSLEKSQGGLGIGLCLVKRLVEMHGGSVEAKSEGHGKGSEFIVRLPVAQSVRREVKLPTDEDNLVSPAGKRRFLVADDNRDSADSMAMLLTIMGNEVRTANDGAQAVDVAAEFRPDVILLDIGMPKLNGYEACRRIRALPCDKDIVMIALTGWGQDEDKRRSQEAGFNYHMVKPVDHAALTKILSGLQTKAV